MVGRCAPARMPQATATAVPHNKTRFCAYERVARQFLVGELYDAHRIAQMLHDMQWPEVAAAFSAAIYQTAKEGGALRPDLQAEFANLVAYVAFLAFGSTERRVAQPWFLKNWDTFLVECINGLVDEHDQNRVVGEDDAQRERTLRHAFEGVLALAGGAKRFMSLDRLADSSAVHALLVAAGHCGCSFLWRGLAGERERAEALPSRCRLAAQRPLTMAHAVLMGTVASAVLATDDHDVATWERAFGHYAGATRWRDFANRCAQVCAGRSTAVHAILALEYRVQGAFARALSAAEAAEATGRVHHRKRKRAAVEVATANGDATVRSLLAEWEEQTAVDAMAVAMAGAPLDPSHAWLSPPTPSTRSTIVAERGARARTPRPPKFGARRHE